MINLGNTSDTICALATPAGTSAIAVIRISGKDSFSIIKKIFRPSAIRNSVDEYPSHTVHHGDLEEDGRVIDNILVTVFRSPRSYTGEDIAEISCHGSPFIQQKILSLLIRHGARMATPGEFTLRAFLNKKLDLSRAEAVADLIASHSDASHELAVRQMRGGFSRKIAALRESLVTFTTLIELELDFSEEQMVFADREELKNLLTTLESELTQLTESFSLGNVIRHGIPVAIVGKPNVGKSTLLNAILNEEKAIVSEIPGTTRDAIEDTIVIGGYSFRFIDTAGLRASEDRIENIGMERTWEKINEASVILYVFDATQHSFSDVQEALSEFSEALQSGKKHLILVGNKMDMLDELPKGFREFLEFETIFVSGKRKENIHEIAGHLHHLVVSTHIPDNTIVTNTRHYEALKLALDEILLIRDGLTSGLSPDLLTINIHQALYHLGSITGEITTDEILGGIFGRFCIGK
jgi:tRNA modification GTPase